MKSWGLVTSIFMLAACATSTQYDPPSDVDEQVAGLMEEYAAASVGIGIIRNGEFVWTGILWRRSAWRSGDVPYHVQYSLGQQGDYGGNGASVSQQGPDRPR